MGIVTVKEIGHLTHQEWMGVRHGSLGASDVPVVVFGNNWSCNLDVFYSKISGVRNNKESLRTLIGRETQTLSSKMWRHYDGVNQQSVADNIENKTPVRNCIDLSCTYYNTDYPHLSASPDAKILPEFQYKGKGFGALEIKNTQSRIIKMYETGIPTDNLVQNVVQQMVTTWNYGELFYFLDNMSVNGFFIEKRSTKNLQQIILDHTIPFWESVLKGRVLYNQLFEAKRSYNMKLANEIDIEIQRLEPPPQNNSAYLNFLTERYKERLSGSGIIPGTNDQLLIAKKHKELSSKIKKLEQQQQQLEIELKLIIKDNNILDFGSAGKVTYFQNKNGNRLFKNSIK